MDNKINLTMEDLDKVTGGEIGQLSAEMLLRSIPIFKERGMTLEEFLMEIRRRGWSEEVIAFCTANW